jgi:hypothetical protein
MMATLDSMAAEGKLNDVPAFKGIALRDQWPADMKPKFIPTAYILGSGTMKEDAAGMLDASKVKEFIRQKTAPAS